MKILNNNEVDWNYITIKTKEGIIVGKIYNWFPHQKTYEKIYEMKHDDYKKFLPVKMKWTLGNI